MMLCKLFGHKFISSKLSDWLKDKTNFICKRCGKRVKNVEGTLWKNRNR